MSEEVAVGVRDRVLTIMRERKVTINAIARRMGRHESAVRAWLYGQRADTKLSTLGAIVRELGAEVTVVGGGNGR